MRYVIGIDVGGTFTDLAACDEQGTTVIAKAPTTPGEQEKGVLQGLALLAGRLDLSLAELLARTRRIVHGTTVATNALLEAKGARVALLTTAGHRDMIEMREGLKPERYNLRMAPPTPLIAREWRLEVVERLAADGSVLIPLDEASLERALDVCLPDSFDAVAICFLHAWKNPAHERRAAELVRARLPGHFVTCSHEVLPVIKEYERFSTTIANAMVGPIVQGYLGRLEGQLREAGLKGPLFIILSHGGIASVQQASRLAVATALSGPAGGIAAAVALAQAGAGEDLLTFDMGGTSTDIAVIDKGQPFIASARSVGHARIALPSLEITTLGAGGGSIAYVDRAGMLQVGPESAGADPGPACYGKGGTRPAVTDANLVLGYLDPASFVVGRGQLDREASLHAIGQIGRDLGLSVEETAFGIHRLVNAKMADGLRLATVRRGIDPQKYKLLSFGGAAGLHVCAVAAELGISEVIVPLEASVLSAWGMLTTDLRVEMMRSISQANGTGLQALNQAFEEMAQEGASWFSSQEARISLQHSADMRYGEQVFEIPVSLEGIDRTNSQAIATAFHKRHEALFTYALPDQEVVIVNARLSMTGALDRVSPKPLRREPDSTTRTRRIVDEQGRRDIPVRQLTGLKSGESITGPALLESDTTTIRLRENDAALLSDRGWLSIRLAKP